MKNKSVCFTGHRNLEPEAVSVIRERLREAIEIQIERGFTDFYNGGARGFDLLSAEEVLRLRTLYPHIRLHIIVPCEGQTKGWCEEDKSLYDAVLSCADEVKVLSPFYFNGCMQIRNRYMADNSELVIAYLEKNSGGSAYTVKYARQQGKEIVNVFDMI